MDDGNTKTPSMHSRLGSATLSQLAFPGESNLNFPWEKSQLDNTVVKKKKKGIETVSATQTGQAGGSNTAISSDTMKLPRTRLRIFSKGVFARDVMYGFSLP